MTAEGPAPRMSMQEGKGLPRLVSLVPAGHTGGVLRQAPVLGEQAGTYLGMRSRAKHGTLGTNPLKSSLSM